ncbi:MAG: pirin family protein [Pseudomonadota bacterium]
MNPRTIKQRIGGMAVSEGAGVTVIRSIGLPGLRNLDPFLMLDHFGTDRPEDYIAGFPDHPHRGFVTFTYMIDGHMEHRDSMGNTGDLRAGGAQWMKAASGVIHSEMPKQTEGLMRGFQLWINLPARDKMSDPAYREITAAEIPEVTTDTSVVKVLAGQYAGVSGSLQDPVTHLQYLDVQLAPGGRFEHQTASADTAFIYIFEGEVNAGGTPLPTHQLAVLADGEVIAADAGAQGGRFILVAGTPLHEPIVQHGPFVMNTREEIEQALADYRDNKLVRAAAHPGV